MYLYTMLKWRVFVEVYALRVFLSISVSMLQSLLDPYCVWPLFHELHGMCLNSPLFRICYIEGMQTVNQVKSSCLLLPMSVAQVLPNKMLTVFHQHKYST